MGVGGCLDIFSLIYLFSFLSPFLWETARYRLKYCLKGPLNPKQPTNQPTKYPAAGHVITGNLKIISDSRIRSIIAKGPKYRFPVQIDFQKCREKIAGSLNEFCNRWCKRENVECDALKYWKLNIFKIIDRRISFYSQNTNMLPRKPKISYRYLKSGIEEFHRKYVLVPADKAANNVVVV